jgi:Ca-activated chloride channel family protein
MRTLSRLLLSLAALGAPVVAQDAPVSALIVFDASGSMWGQIKGRPKIEIAREVVAGLVRDLPESTELGLMAYGHRRKGDCADIELLIPVGKVNKSAFIETVNAIMPKGMTPITASLELAAEGMGYKENKATVILVSDGLETCDADPCAAAKKLEQLGVDFTAHVIAFDLKPEETEKLRCVSDSTGGKFFPASDAASLKDALDFAVSAAAAKPEPAAGDDRTAKLTAPAAAVAGSVVEVAWEIDTAEGDYITIAKAGAPDHQSAGYRYTHEKQTAGLTTLIEPGKAEIRYISGITSKVLARALIELTPFTITLKAPAEVTAGSEVSIEWTGPGYERDFITIVPKSAPDGVYEKWAYTTDGSPLAVTATLTPGESEIRYMTEDGNQVLARAPIQVVKGEITIKAAAEAVAGTNVAIEWTGPNNKGDFFTIVPKAEKDGVYQKWTYTDKGSPLDVTATRTVGPAEIRYMNEDGNKVLARVPITITAAVITLKAAAQGIAGEKIAVEWTGPDAPGDYITIVPKSAEDGRYESYAYTRDGSPASITACAAGDAEIRYMNEDGNVVLHRIPIQLIEGEAEE